MKRTNRGFTMLEVLAALVLIGIALPMAMNGITIVVSAASNAKHRAEAATLAQAKLNELATTGDWQTVGRSGDFGASQPDYKWTLDSAPADFDLTEVQLTVQWTDGGGLRTFSVSTLATGGTGTSTGTGATP